MDANRWQRIKTLLEAARELSAEDRAEFLSRECGSDEELRHEVESLLAAGGGAESFLGSVGDTLDSDAVPHEAGTAPMPTTVGRYRILRKLGAGGMGVVYEAEQQSPQRRVALKVVRGGRFVDGYRVRLFQREAETLARLKHPNIAAIYESGRTEDGQHFFAMELVSGQTLDAYLKARPQRVTPEELRFRLNLFRKLADAVHYAHQRGVIHRDLKPSNIIVAASDPPEPKILDFGLARITEKDLAVATLPSEVGLIKGTLPYMSPEQTRADPEEIDMRADVYSLGVILYEMLSGQQPYDVTRRALGEAVRVICEEAPRPLGRSWSGVRRLDVDVETIVGKALEKEADRRYASAAAFSEDIGRYLDSQPILARPPSAVYHLRKFAQRNRTLVGGVLATTVALVAGVVVSTVFGLREAEQRRAADRARDTLETVVRFQASMLSRVDPQQMGRGVIEDLRERVAEARRMQGDSPEAVEHVVSTFDRWMAGVNATDAAVHVLDGDILEPAAKAIEEEFGDQPEVAARLEHTVAQAYSDLGRFDRAETHVRSAVEKRREALGPDHPDTLASLAGLGAVLASQGRLDAAAAVLDEVHETRARVLGREHLDTLETRRNLAAICIVQNRLDEAEPLLREVYEARERILGREHKDTLDAMYVLAAVLARQGRYAEAQPLFAEVLEGQRKTLGDEHVDTLFTMYGLGALYMNVGEYEAADMLLRAAIEGREHLLGEEHPNTLEAKRVLAKLREEQGRIEEAESLYREILEIRTRVLGEDHPDTASAKNDLAHILRRQQPFVPTDQYEKRAIDGWTVHVNKDLLDDGTELGTEALTLLEAKLAEVAHVVPERACRELRRIPIWLGVDDGYHPTAEYHTSREWLEAHGYNPDKAKSVEIGNAAQFLAQAGREPRMVFHLLAVAYLDRVVLGSEHERIQAAQQAAAKDGRPAGNGPMYFARGTVAFFSPDPAVRDELRRKDPTLFALLEDVW